MDHVTCSYIFKRDGSICGKTCTYITGCTKHQKLYGKNMQLNPCPVSGCPRYTDSDTGYCRNHSGRFHSLNYRMRQKYGAEALQSGIPSGNIPEMIPKGSARIIDSDGEGLDIDLLED